MRMLTRLPVGAILSAVAAIICAVPTLVLPADSPNEPKVALLAVAGVIFLVAVARVRSEKGSAPSSVAGIDGNGALPVDDPRE